MQSSSTARTPTFQLAAEQQSIGKCWISPKKKIPHVQGQRRKPNKTIGRAKSHLESDLSPTRGTQRVQTKPCAQQVPGKEAVTSKETRSELALSV